MCVSCSKNLTVDVQERRVPHSSMNHVVEVRAAAQEDGSRETYVHGAAFRVYFVPFRIYLSEQRARHFNYPTFVYVSV